MSTKVDYKQKTMELFEKIKLVPGTDEAIQMRNQVVTINLPLVSTVLKKYRPYTEDQFQIGCVGLIKAADTYEATREVPFHNYACFVIERELQMDFNRRMESFEGRNQDKFVYLDAMFGMDNGDEVSNENMVADEEATRYMEQFIEDNALEYLCDVIIKPAIKETADKGRKMKSKINFDVWEQLEFRYIMSIVFEESQKKRFNLTQMAKECEISLPNIRNRHVRVMDIIFQRMWSHMTFSFTDLLERIRGGHNIPQRLLCLDPGKTTGWCLFENGKLTRWGQVPECYDDKNIDVAGLTTLFNDVQPDFVLYEDYRVYSNKLDRHSYSPVMTVRLLGLIETYCQMNNIPTHKQMATTAKNFCTDAKLQQWGFWQTGMRHARDAIRHGCYFLLFYKKGMDIV
jgi:DNA-directed RNA polymerase specialized sigma subunit